MIRKNNSVKIKFFILIGIYVALVPFSFAWYSTINGINCSHIKSNELTTVKINTSTDNEQTCLQKINFHWIKFYGINGIIYSVPLAALLISVKKYNMK